MRPKDIILWLSTTNGLLEHHQVSEKDTIDFIRKSRKQNILQQIVILEFLTTNNYGKYIVSLVLGTLHKFCSRIDADFTIRLSEVRVSHYIDWLLTCTTIAQSLLQNKCQLSLDGTWDEIQFWKICKKMSHIDLVIEL